MALGSQQRRREEQTDEMIGAAERTAMDPTILASVASVLLSWYYFYVRGDKTQGIFIGLWAPTFLSFGSYYRGARMNEMLDKLTHGSGLMAQINEQVDRVLRQR